MSSSNNFTQKLNETPINTAYDFQTCDNVNENFIQKIKELKFSVTCIFCSCQDTTALVNDGSFRNCKKCKKNFRSSIYYR
uniref:Uncharacterized protein n=1 Tax=viral metagenome TaxID=1070528 RepID=A0A6C0DL98_9ZZZZ